LRSFAISAQLRKKRTAVRLALSHASFRKSFVILSIFTLSEMMSAAPWSMLIEFGRAKLLEGKTTAPQFTVATMPRSHPTKAVTALKKK
jgi:hypothetical protein